MLGRQKKHLGDLSLQAGLAAEAWNYYQAYFLIICFIGAELMNDEYLYVFRLKSVEKL